MAAEEALKRTNELARPSFIEESTAGTEGISRDEIKFPRLAIAQGLSPQMIPGDSAFIQGLTLFQMFNDLSSDIYGTGPIQFVVGRRDVKRIEFDPNDRKIPVDLNVPPNDPRMVWTKDPDTGKGVPPRAIKFVEFSILLLREGRQPEPVVMSIQETNKFNKKAHERLSGFIKMRQPPAPIYAGLYTVMSKPEKNDKGTFGVFWVENAGYIQDEGLYKASKAFHDGLIGKTIVVDRDPNLDPDAFDPSAMDNNDPHGM